MRRSPLVLTAAVLAAVLVATPACGAVVAGEWGMHRVNGVVSDAVGNTDLRLVGSWQDVEGVVGRAVRATFKGQASFATAAHSADLNPGASQFAVAAYLRAETVPGGRPILTERRTEGPVHRQRPMEDAADTRVIRDGG